MGVVLFGLSFSCCGMCLVFFLSGMNWLAVDEIRVLRNVIPSSSQKGVDILWAEMETPPVDLVRAVWWTCTLSRPTSYPIEQLQQYHSHILALHCFKKGGLVSFGFCRRLYLSFRPVIISPVFGWWIIYLTEIIRRFHSSSLTYFHSA